MLACALCITHRPLPTRSRAFNYKRADWDGLRASLILCPGALLDDMGVNDAVDLFYDLLEAAVSDHVSTVTLSRKYPWFDNQVRGKRAQKKKEKASIAKKRHPTSKKELHCSKRNFFSGIWRFPRRACQIVKSLKHFLLEQKYNAFSEVGGRFFFFWVGKDAFSFALSLLLPGCQTKDDACAIRSRWENGQKQG